MDPVVKSEGVTTTEKLLAQFCDKTFLRLWSYPNPRKDDGHEICDVLAVFENHVFIFFDRAATHLEKLGGDPDVQWQRWKRATIDRQVDAIAGAERYLRSGRRIFLDAKQTTPLPVTIPTDGVWFHRIVVAHGAAAACKAFSSDNITGSLAMSYCDNEALGQPFFVDLKRQNPVHVFDSHTLEIVFSELDTVTEFTWYLEAKETAISKYQHLMYCGEEDLLAHYRLSYDETTNRHRIGVTDESVNSVYIEEGLWQDLIARQEYQSKKKADEVSYFWDRLLQHTGQNALDRKLLGNAPVFDGDSAIREMAKEPRFMRRAISEHMLSLVRRFPDDVSSIQRLVSFVPSFYSEKGYVFLQVNVPKPRGDEELHRERRQALLRVACGAARNKLPHLTRVIGIAVDAPKHNAEVAEDSLLLRCENWDENLREEFEAANRELGFFQSASLQVVQKRVTNFPSS